MRAWSLGRLVRVGRPPAPSPRRLFRPSIEELENRLSPAQYTWNAAAHTLLVDLETAESLTVTASGSNLNLTLSSGVFSQNGGDTAVGNGTGELAIASAELSSSVTIKNTLAAAGTNDINFRGSGSLNTSALRIALTDPDAVGTIAFDDGFDVAATTVLDLSTNRAIRIGPGTELSTVDGNLTLSANQQALATSDYFIGIHIDGGRLVTTGAGDIVLRGRGGNQFFSNHGIVLENGAIVESTSSGLMAGTITLSGQGGSGLFFDHGLLMDVTARVTSVRGAIVVTGSAVSEGSIGLQIDGRIESTGAGAGGMRLEGTGGLGSPAGENNGITIGGRVESVDSVIDIIGQGGPSGSTSTGVHVRLSAVIASSGSVGGVGINVRGTGGGGSSTSVGIRIDGTLQSQDGAIVVKGTGGAGSAFNDDGIVVTSGGSGAGMIVSTGTAPIELLGIGGTGGSFSNRGLTISSLGSVISQGSGPITLTGLGGSGPGDCAGIQIGQFGTLRTASGVAAIHATAGDSGWPAFSLAVNGLIESTGGPIDIAADHMNLAGAIMSQGTVQLQPLTADGTVAIDIGGADTATALGLTDDELDRVTAGVIHIGDENVPRTVSVTGAIEHAADDSFVVATGRAILFTPGSSWTTRDGNLTFQATRSLLAEAGNGIEVNAATITTTGSGNLQFNGRGGNLGQLSNGVRLRGGALVVSTDSAANAGAITLDGVGGNGANNNFGIMLDGGGTRVASVGGAIRLLGRGGHSSGGSNSGILLFQNAEVRSTGPASIELVGTGGTPTVGGDGNHGILVLGGAKVVSQDTGPLTLTGQGGGGGQFNFGIHLNGTGTQVTSVAGAITLMGQGGGNGTENHGVRVANNATVQSTAVDADTLRIGGSGAPGTARSHGIVVESGGRVSAGGALALTGAAGLDDAFGIQLGLEATVAAQRDITISTDRIHVSWDGPIPAVINASDHTVFLRTLTEDGTVGIDLGGADSGTTLGLSHDELEQITAKRLSIGDPAGGVILISAPIIRGVVTDIELHSGGAIVFDPGRIDTAGGNLLLAGVGGVEALSAGVDVTGNTLSLASDLISHINGTAVDSGYAQLNAVGAVNLTGASLVLTGDYVPQVGDTFVVVEGSTIVGQFQGLPEGASLMFHDRQLKVHYTATTVTLTTVVIPIYAVAAGTGGAPRVKVYNADGSLRFSFLAFGSRFRRGVRVATGDINGDGAEDVVIAAGRGGPPRLKVFDGRTHGLIRNFLAFPSTFRAGLFVATGEINNDGRDDIIVGADAGALPRVRVFSGLNNQRLRQFLAFRRSFRGGVRVAAGDINRDGRAEIIVASGPGIRPRVKVFDGQNNGILRNFRGFASGVRAGFFVAAGDIDADGRADIIVARGASARPLVRVFAGADNKRIRQFLAFPSGFPGGVRVGTIDRNGDGHADIIAGAGLGVPRVKLFSGSKPLLLLETFVAFPPAFKGGLYVG